MINLNFNVYVYLNIILKYVCFHSRGSRTRENGANNSGGLESNAIANFIQNIRQFIFWGVQKGHVRKVLRSSGCTQSQEQAAPGETCFHRGL